MPWKDLLYGDDLDAHEAAADPHSGYQKESEKGVANGYASLDAGALLPASQLPAHGEGKHTGKIGETAIVPPIRFVLKKPLPAATNPATLDGNWVYKKTGNIDVRISRIRVRMEANVAATMAFTLYRNGLPISGAISSVSAGTREGSFVAFTEVALADNDILDVYQTTGSAEGIGGSAFVYGDQDVVAQVTY